MYDDMSSKKPHLNLIVTGHVDHGKSTLVGHLLFETGAIDQRTIDELDRKSTRLNSSHIQKSRMPSSA